MKTLITLLLLIVPALASAAPDRPATHGMLVVGKERIFLSHLPMFHRPHDYQVIWEAELPEAAKAVYRQDLAKHPEQRVYTLVPEPFVLPDMIAQPRPFRADLYRGHFERDGVRIARGFVVKLSSQVFAKKFEPGASQPAHPKYLAFGSQDGEQFLAHLISAAPDFDQVLAVKGVTGALPQFLDFAELPSQTPLGESAERKQLYLETGDLSE